MDAQALFSRQGCLGCHVVGKRNVGPSYHEVAAKYREDSGAQSKLQESIHRGSVGKWGSVPMPPFSQLQADEIKALAEYVLGQ